MKKKPVLTTKRNQQMQDLFIKGWSVQRIAKKFKLTESGVRYHLNRFF